MKKKGEPAVKNTGFFLKNNKIVEFSLAHTAHTAQLYPNSEMFSRSKNRSLIKNTPTLAALAVDSR